MRIGASSDLVIAQLAAVYRHVDCGDGQEPAPTCDPVWGDLFLYNVGIRTIHARLEVSYVSYVEIENGVDEFASNWVWSPV